MKKNRLYLYNPETDNFERFYPTIKDRLFSLLSYLGIGLLIAGFIFIIVFCVLDNPADHNLRAENKELKSQLHILDQRVSKSLSVLNDIQSRDDNFYRVMMQMEPMSQSQRNNIFNNRKFDEIAKVSDNQLVMQLSRQVDLLDRKIASQSISFDQLKKAAVEQRDKLDHIPSIMPINIEDYTMSSGFGWRRDPIYRSFKFHQGLDFAAPTGTKVYATADGKVSYSNRKGEYGNYIEIEHGYNYITRYAHLSQLAVKEGEIVKRGQLIGYVGSTGKSTGSHLHYEVRFKDEAQNPVNYYFMDITPEQYNQLISMSENAGYVMD